jgi:hypothetical protein
VGFLRGLLGGGDAEEPVTVVLHDVSHRVFVEAAPDAVWQALVAPAPAAARGVDCVGLVALPRPEPTGLPEFAGVWRRADGRLWAGLSTVVDLEPGRRVVARSADGAVAFELTTTVEPLDHGTVVSQVLAGLSPDDPLSGFARSWLARGLLGVKADVEGRPRDVPEATAATASDPWAAHHPAGPGPDGLGVPGVPGALGPGGGTAAPAGTLARTSAVPAWVPVTASAAVDLALGADQVWSFLLDPGSEPLLRPDVERVVRLELADAPGTEHVLAVHRAGDGRRAASLSVLAVTPGRRRIVERDLGSPRESDVETVVEDAGVGCRLTETLTTWLPTSPGSAPDTAALTAFLQARLETVRTLVEAGVAAPRDPRTGFLPPSSPDAGPASDVAPHAAPGAAPGAVPSGRPSVPSSVLLPPPHVVAPARAYVPTPTWWWWGDLGLHTLDLGWW